MVEGFHGLDAAERGVLGVGEVVGHVHHVDGKAHEAAQVLVHHIACPAGPDGGQSGTVGNVEHSAQLVLQLVGGPVVADAASGQSPVSHASAPHDLRPLAIVLGIFQHGKHGGLHPAQHGLGQVGGQVHVVVLGEIAFHGVHHHVGDAGRRLIGRQGERAARVHNGKLGPRHVVAIAQLHVAVLVGDDAGLAHLAAGGGDGEHGGHGEHLFRLGLAKVEVPHVAVVAHAVGYALRRVDDAAPAHGEDEVHTLPAAQVDALLGFRQPRIGHHAAQGEHLQAALAKQAADFVEQARALGALTAVVNQHFRAAILLCQTSHLLLRLFAEHHFRRRVVIKVFHY